MHLLCVIPARLGSTRLPNKPLCPLADEPLIRHTVRRVLQLDLGVHVVVAADDPAILRAVHGLDVEPVLSGREHESGTSRVAEVAALPRFSAYDAVINLQADEPFVSAEAVVGAIDRVRRGDAVGTAGAPLTPVALADRERVKVVADAEGRALRFARTVPASIAWGCDVAVLQHVGVYVFTKQALNRWITLPPVPEERTERLEQLRPMHYGMTIGVARTAALAGPAVDTPDDLEHAEAYMAGLSPWAVR